MVLYEWDAYDDNTVTLKFTFSSKDVGFSFEKAVSTFTKKVKGGLKIEDKLPVPAQFYPYMRRQTKRYSKRPMLEMRNSGMKLLSLDISQAYYDTSIKDDWKLIIIANGKYDKLAEADNGNTARP